jgi:hypothetical protein
MASFMICCSFKSKKRQPESAQTPTKDNDKPNEVKFLQLP